MRLHVSLLLTVLALHARAATIAGPRELEKKLPTVVDSKDPPKDVVPAENVFSEQELIDSANTVKEIENNLRVKAIDSIPVAVIVDGDVSNPVENEVTPDVKRAPLDLSNPGEPQRQEHETQNAVHYDDAQQIVTSVKQTVVDTQNALKQGFQGVTQGIQNWIANSEQLSAIQASINNLQENFQNQISKLNNTIHSFWNNRIGSEPPTQINIDSKPQIENVESHLKNLEDNFQTGVKALSEGVQVFATLKAENENPSSPTPTAPNNLLVQYLQLFQNTLTQGFNNVTHAIQNFVGQGNNQNNTNASSGGLLQSFNNGIQNIFNPSSTTQAASAQGNVEGSTLRPTIWQGIQSSLQNVLNPNQAQNQASATQTTNGTPNRPIAQAIQNLPFVQGIVNLIQPNRPTTQPPAAQGAQPATAQPAEPAQPSESAQPVEPAQPEKPAEAESLTQPGSNAVGTQEPEKPTDAKEPAKEPEKPQAVPEQPNNNGPIRNIIQNNPIVKGISGAVQRLQASINNPEKPREGEQKPEKTPEKKPEKEIDEKTDVKGEHGRGGHYSNAGHNNDSNGVVKSLPEKVESVEQPAPEAVKVEEEKPQETDKTDKS